ncbi:hypothetical protein HELRODRAFT_145562, partial [Helobdella robusta]|uniref:Transglutaminase-like domain-containing protein n=1 Tax=Helobdella robusta TaxID=6412 RepID=T1EJL1_HELRO
FFYFIKSFLGLKSVCIKGWAKGENYLNDDYFHKKKPNHTWNAVLLQEKWCLIDCFWSRNLMNTHSLEHFDDFFFCIEPEKMIYSHFPEHSVWQLLSDHLSFDDFINLPYLKPEFFKYKLSL